MVDRGLGIRPTSPASADPERDLALAYAPAAARPALAALWQVDRALARVVAGGGPAQLRAIKLVWWRDALAALDAAPAPAEPVLEAAAALLLPLAISGADLAAVEEGWAVLLSEEPLTDADLADYAARGRHLFALAARLLGHQPPDWLGRAGEGWALIDLARRSSDGAEASRARILARERLAGASRWPAPLRSLGALAVLAGRDAAGEGAFEPPGSPRRVLRMLAHRLTGR